MVVFVVEPDAVLLDQYAAKLSENVGWQIITFRTASLAVKALEKAIPDVILLELALPGHNGLELLYELRSYADTDKTRVVINSFVQEPDVPFGFVNRGDLGIVEYLHKPFAGLDEVCSAVIDAGRP
jgi:DNA-binding response OmpR family regulator